MPLNLRNDEKILYDDLVSKIKIYSPTGEVANRIIDKLNVLLEEVIKNDESEEYNDWNF